MVHLPMFPSASGLSAIKGGLNIIQADYNNDGYLDILVLRGAWLGEFGKQPNSLLRNNGDGTFTDVTIESGLLSFHPTLKLLPGPILIMTVGWISSLAMKPAIIRIRILQNCLLIIRTELLQMLPKNRAQSIPAL